jgi:hypothetical protein
LARYEFPAEAQVDFETGVTYAIEMLRQEHPEIDLLDDGMFMQVQKAREDDA